MFSIIQRTWCGTSPRGFRALNLVIQVGIWVGFFFTNISHVNEGTKGRFADTAICFSVNIRGFGFEFVLGDMFYTDSWFQHPCLRKASNHKFRQKWCPVASIIQFHLLPYSWEILKDCEGGLELYYLQFILQKTWRVTSSTCSVLHRYILGTQADAHQQDWHELHALLAVILLFIFPDPSSYPVMLTEAKKHSF